MTKKDYEAIALTIKNTVLTCRGGTAYEDAFLISDMEDL